jgi:hypothetical protein
MIYIVLIFFRNDIYCAHECCTTRLQAFLWMMCVDQYWYQLILNVYWKFLKNYIAYILKFKIPNRCFVTQIYSMHTTFHCNK